MLLGWNEINVEYCSLAERQVEKGRDKRASVRRVKENIIFKLFYFDVSEQET